MSAAERFKPSQLGESLHLTGFQSEPLQAGLPLDELHAALAKMMDRGADPYAPQAGDERSEIALAAEPTGGQAIVNPRTIVEAILFVGSPDNQPIEASRICALMRGVRASEVEQMIRELNADYRDNRCPYEIISDGAGFRMSLRPEYEPLRQRCHARQRRARLSKSAVEVLSIVAYHQPIGAAEIDKLRGKSSAALLRQLVRRQLLAVERDASRGRTLHYRTTDRFLDLFGLANLGELPRVDALDRS
jgi:segregation and condensation protein B